MSFYNLLFASNEFNLIADQIFISNEKPDTFKKNLQSTYVDFLIEGFNEGSYDEVSKAAIFSTLIIFALLAWGDLNTNMKHVFEWNYFSALLVYYFLSRILWRN